MFLDNDHQHEPMTYGLCFWILMLLWLVLGLWQNRANYKAAGSALLLFLLLLLLGWQVFGPALHK